MSIQSTPAAGAGVSAALSPRAADSTAAAAEQGRPPAQTQLATAVGAGRGAPAMQAPHGADQPNAQDIQQALAEVREALAPVARNLLFSIDDDTGKTVIRIVDSSTDELVKQIPSEEILAISRAIDKLQGLLIKQEA